MKPRRHRNKLPASIFRSRQHDTALRDPKSAIRQRPSDRWMPMERACDHDGRHSVVVAGMTHRLYKNDRYTVHLRQIPAEGGRPPMLELSIRRNDRMPVTDWRDVQRIKNDLAGPECEAVQVFPAESRLVDTSNQYYLYVLPPGLGFSFGFNDRLVSDAQGTALAPNAAQRPWPETDRPADCLDGPTMDALALQAATIPEPIKLAISPLGEPPRLALRWDANGTPIVATIDMSLVQVLAARAIAARAPQRYGPVVAAIDYLESNPQPSEATEETDDPQASRPPV